MSMWKECEGLQEELVKIRRELHQIPEFGFDLPETQKYVTDKLDELGIPYKCSGTDSSIIAEIKGGQPGKTVALRADMDALKITEANDVDYKSKHEGLMHACGHDNHITMLLGAAKVLNAHKAEIKGNVRLLFQTAEELSKGAEIMIKDGWCRRCIWTAYWKYHQQRYPGRKGHYYSWMLYGIIRQICDPCKRNWLSWIYSGKRNRPDHNGISYCN